MKIKRVLIMLSLALIFPAAARADGECPDVHEGPIAVFIEPSDENLDALRERNWDNYVAAVDAAGDHQSQAIEFLEKMNFPYCFSQKKRQVFKVSPFATHYGHEKMEGWRMILWNGKDASISISPAHISRHESYLKRAKLE